LLKNPAQGGDFCFLTDFFQKSLSRDFDKITSETKLEFFWHIPEQSVEKIVASRNRNLGKRSKNGLLKEVCCIIKTYEF